MIRVLILVSLGTIISAFSLSDLNVPDYPRSLINLFGLNKRDAVETKNERTICETEECKYIAKVLKDSMDETVDPCEDFYEYACGNWEKNNPIPEGEVEWDSWSLVQSTVTKQIKELIQKETKHDDLFAVKMAKKWYKSCMDIERIDETGLESLINSLWRYGGWPLIMEDGEWDDRVYTWQNVDDHYARLTGLNAFHDVQAGMMYWLPEGGTIVLFDTPHIPYMTYRHLMTTPPRKHGDSSDENNESGEVSHETGSREIEIGSKGKVGKTTENDAENKDEDDEDDEEALEEKTLTKRKLKTKVIHSKKDKNHKSKASAKRTDKNKMKKRIKRRTMEARVHKNKYMKHKQNHVRNTMKKTIEILKHKSKHFRNNREEPAESNSEDDDEDNDGNEDSVDDDNEDGDGDEDAKEDENEDDNDDEDSEEDTKEDSDNSDDDSSEESQFDDTYKEAMKYIAKTLVKARGVEISEERINKGVDDLVEFQNKLMEIMRSGDLENMTLSTFQEAYESFEPTTRNGKVDWIGKMKKLFDQAGTEIDDSLTFVVGIQYVSNLTSLLDETPSETIVNYVHWNFIVHMLKATSKDFRYLHYGGAKSDSDEDLRSNECIQEVVISRIISYEYAKQYFPEKVAQTAKDMIDDIQKEVEHQIKESKWMDEETRQYILDKLVYMDSMVGYPDWYKNTTAVKLYFQGLTLGPSYYENVLNFMRFRKWKELRYAVEQDIQDMEDMDPLMLNAFFSPTENYIAVTAVDFQTPFFAFNRPWYVNFGIIGLVMGHEVNHGFDNDGRLFDKKGKPLEWLPAMARAYNKRAQCFVDQYNNYKFGEAQNITIENYGNQTTGENIADTMGLHAVFRAYRRRERECQKPDPALPGLEKFSNDQLFFISLANLWCTKVDEKKTLQIAKWDVHSTPRLRVIGPISNSEDFAKAFNCPAGSPMNPEEKCNIWK